MSFLQTDGQLYNVTAPPTPPPEIKCEEKRKGIGTDEILILGLIYLIFSDKKGGDIPLLLALVYILMF